MTTLRGIELTDGIVVVFKRSINDASDAVVLHFAKYADEQLLRGIRPNKQNVPLIKKRLVSKIGAGGKITKNQLVVLSAYRPLEFLEDFEIQMLDGQLDNFCAVYGCDEVLASLLLDEREMARELAEGVLSGGRKIEEKTDEEKREFAERAVGFFNPFFLKLFDLLDHGEEEDVVEEPEPASCEPATVHSSKAGALKKRIETLERQNKKLAEERKDYKKRASKCDEATAALTKAEKDRDRLRQKVAALEKALGESQVQFEELDAAIAGTVDDRVHSSLHAWIRTPEEMEEASKALETSDNDDVLKRAERVIARQQEVDRHAGNRGILLARLEQLSDLKTQVEELAIVSINPLKELAAVDQELEQEIRRIRGVLALPTDESTFVQNAMSKIGMAAHPDELSAYKRMLSNISDLGVLSSSEVRSLFAYCDDRMSLLYEKYVPSINAPKAIVDPVYRLKRSIADNSKILWMLDGHNVLLTLTDVFGAFDEAGHHTESSRLALSDFLVRITRNVPECQVQLFYDGPEYNEIQASPNVKVIYSGGEGDHRADDAICTALEYQCRQMNGVPFLLTTDDRGLALQAERLGSSIMSLNEFFALVRAEKGERVSPHSASFFN